MKKVLFSIFLIIASLMIAFPSSAAYTNINLTGFQNIEWQKSLTGEIYYTMNPSLSFYSYCVDRSTSMPVPANYFAEKLSIAGDLGLLRGAWLMDNFAYSKSGVFPGFTAAQTGTTVQLAIWDVIGQGIAVVPGYENLFNAKSALVALANTKSLDQLAYLSAKYAKLDIYNDSSKTRAYQDLLTPVPVPSAVWLLGAGLIGLVGLRRRLKK